MTLSDLFEVKNGLASSEAEISDQKTADFFVPYIRPSSSYANLVAGYLDRNKVNKKYIFSSESIIVSTDGEGSHTYSYVSPVDFVPNSNVAVLIPKRQMSLKEKIYYSLCITKNRYRFSYGRKPKGERLQRINLPDKMPDRFEKIGLIDETEIKKSISNKKISLNTEKWEWFDYPEAFDVVKGHYNNRPELDDQGIPFISATENNNGITDFVAREGTKIFSGKSITVTNDGSIGNAFYQENDFTCSHSVNVIKINKKYNKELNQYIALFLIPLIQKEKFRFNYGFKWRIERMKESKIKLPVDKDGDPDWRFMEDYIKSLPYSARV